MKLTKRHEGKTVKIQDAFLATAYRTCFNRDLGTYHGAGGCSITFDTLCKPATIFCVSDNKQRCLIQWADLNSSMWIDADLIENAN